MGQFQRFTHRWVRYNLGSVLVEHDGVEVAALVVLDEIIRGVAGLHAAVPHVLVLLQRLVQREDDLAVVLQKVASELHPKVRNHGEGPY